MTEPSPPSPPRSPEEGIAALYRAAGYDVERAVGPGPELGTVDWFATPKSGFERPRTYFRALPKPPRSVESALEELEDLRSARGVDRALGIVLNGTLPTGYAAEALKRPANVVTFRRWLLELSGLADHVRQSVVGASSPPPYLPRRARLDSGEEVDVERHLDEWSQKRLRPRLIVAGEEMSGRSTVIFQASRRIALRFTKDPENVVPLVAYSPFAHTSIVHSAASLGVFAPVALPVHQEVIEKKTHSNQWRHLVHSGDEWGVPPADVETRRLELLPPTVSDVVAWMQAQIGSVETRDALADATNLSRDFAALLVAPHNLRIWVQAFAEPLARGRDSVEQWIARAVIRYVEILNAAALGDVQFVLEDAALHDFAIGTPYETWSLGPHPADDNTLRLASWSWLDASTYRFHNNLVRDYYLARKIVREFTAGRSEVMLRHQFPPDVFLFLVNLAPEVAASLSQDKAAHLSQKVQEEAERRLHLTFAHLLNRPVGVIHAHLNEIRDALDPALTTALARHFEGIRAEVEYVHDVAERIRLWRTLPEEPLRDVAVRSLVTEVGAPLQRQYPDVAFSVHLDEELRAEAMHDALRDVVQCLLENAFHAVLDDRSLRSPEVRVSARAIGDIVRIEVRDSGPGVPAGDRERIFEPLVTTKKGGRDKPRGTGLGLAIARRYAEAMGARIGLDARQTETAFFIDLVLWRAET